MKSRVGVRRSYLVESKIDSLDDCRYDPENILSDEMLSYFVLPTVEKLEVPCLAELYARGNCRFIFDLKTRVKIDIVKNTQI